MIILKIIINIESDQKKTQFLRENNTKFDLSAWKSNSVTNVAWGQNIIFGANDLA